MHQTIDSVLPVVLTIFAQVAEYLPVPITPHHFPARIA
jgi:hypothetical protein